MLPFEPTQWKLQQANLYFCEDASWLKHVLLWTSVFFLFLYNFYVKKRMYVYITYIEVHKLIKYIIAFPLTQKIFYLYSCYRYEEGRTNFFSCAIYTRDKKKKITTSFNTNFLYIKSWNSIENKTLKKFSFYT